MRIERESVGILAIIGAVLLPMWAIALFSGEPAHPVALAEGVDPIVPTGRFLPSPVDVNENVAGVITWIALFVLVGMIVYTHRFVVRIGEDVDSITPEDDAEALASDGGLVDVPSFLTAGRRRVVEYYPATMETPGLVSIGLFAWTTVTFAALLVWEGLHLARTQFLGVYAGMMFLSMGVLVAVYASWFLPNVTVAEPRGHEVDDE